MTAALPRRFGLSTATFIVVASMVGSGILISPGYMLLSLGSYPAIFALWILGGGLALCGALCVAELAAAMPQAGGEYVYLKTAFGPLPAFLSGWTSFFIGFSAPLAVNAHVCAGYILAPFTDPDQNGSVNVRLLAAVIILVVTVPNLLGHRRSAWTQNFTTSLKLLLLTGFVVAALLFGNGNLGHLTASKPLATVAPLAVVTQLFYVMFAYSGWNAAGYIAGEIKNPEKLLPRALLLGVGGVVVLYLLLNLAFAYALTPEDVTSPQQAEHIAHLAATKLFGPSVSSLLSIAIGLTFLASVSAYVVTGPRVYYAMARDRLFPKFAAHVHPRYQVPVRAMVAQSALALVILFAAPLESIYRYAAVGLSLFTLLIIGSLFVLRVRAPEMARPFRVPGYPITPAVYLVVTIFIAVFAFVEWPWPSAISLGTILAGIPVYYLSRHLTHSRSS